MPTAAFLSDLQWSLLQPLFPASSRGRPSLDHRQLLEIIFLKLTTHIPWYSLPTAVPSWQACYQRYHRWQVDGTWKSILRTLVKDLAERGGLHLLASIESKSVTIQRNASGGLAITLPPELDGAWQATTAILLIHLLINV